MSLAVEKAAKTMLEVAADLKLPEDVLQKDANKPLRDTYVDDGTMHGSPGDVSGLMGHKLPKGEFNRTMPAMPARWG